MAKSIRTLASWMVNAYLVKTNTGYILIDTGFRFDRKRLDRALSDTGCRPGDLKLIVITHGNGGGGCREKHGGPKRSAAVGI